MDQKGARKLGLLRLLHRSGRFCFRNGIVKATSPIAQRLDAQRDLAGLVKRAGRRAEWVPLQAGNPFRNIEEQETQWAVVVAWSGQSTSPDVKPNVKITSIGLAHVLEGLEGQTLHF